MTRSKKTSEAARGEARQYVAKAEEFLEEARSAAAAGRLDAAMLNAIHAAIAAN
jgi:hypothetical protein